MTVFAYFGPAGTFTEMALDKMLASFPGQGTDGVQKKAAATPAATIEMVRSGAADFGCVPVESSVEGSVPATADALVPHDSGTADRVQVFGEVSLDIAFTIAAREPLPAGQVRTVAAYPVAAAQVRESVEKLYPAARFETAASNSAAATDAAAGRADAAVTTPVAVEAAGLVALADNVADSDDAATRFLLVGKPARPAPRTGSDRTSVILDLPNVPGSLMGAMDEFASRGIDLTRIESRPRRGEPGSYRFFLDAVGHIEDDAVGEALRALHRRCERVVFLGSWPAVRGAGAVPPDTSASARWFEGLLRGVP